MVPWASESSKSESFCCPCCSNRVPMVKIIKAHHFFGVVAWAFLAYFVSGMRDLVCPLGLPRPLHLFSCFLFVVAKGLLDSVRVRA
ncbi:hypothetical protein V8E55_002467 [Tylopilus felleus]